MKKRREERMEEGMEGVGKDGKERGSDGGSEERRGGIRKERRE